MSEQYWAPPAPASSAYSAPVGATTLSVSRTLRADPATVRTQLAHALRAAGFALGVEQLSRLEGTRGSALTGATLQPDKLPLAVSVAIGPSGPSCAVTVDLRDRWPASVSKALGTAGGYRAAFTDVVRLVDGVLGRLDPTASFAPPQFAGDPGGAAPSAPTAAGRIGARVAESTNRFLDGAPSNRRGPAFTFVSPHGAAVLTPQQLQMMLTIGALIVARPGALPPKLAASVEAFLRTVESRLPSPDSGMEGRMQVDEATVPVVEFLHQQARIREQVPLRTLQVCTTCRLEKIANPDFQRLQNRNRRIRVLSGSAGGLVSTHGVSPFVLVGRLVQLKQLDPEYVCPRCQGMAADSSIITFCPSCGDRRAESVLRTCPKCKHDFRRDLPAEPLWQSLAPTYATAPAPSAVAPFPGAPYPITAQPVPALPVGGQPAPALPVASVPVAALPVAPAPVAPAPVAPAPVAPSPVAAGPVPGWYADPTRRHEFRWWDGSRWAAPVADSGTQGSDPL